MKLLTVILLCFFSVLVAAQEKSQFKITDNISKAGILHNTKITDKLILQKGIGINRFADFNNLEIPILFKYNIADSWALFFGGRIRSVINSNNNQFFVNPFEETDISLSIGMDYEFKNGTIGNFSINRPIFHKKNQNNFKDVDLLNSNLDFKLGFKF